jgi:hypothetical protein
MSNIQQAEQLVFVAAAATGYIEVSSGGGIISSVHIRWVDATSNAAITLESSNYDPTVALLTSTVAGQWISESGSVSITGPNATASGGTMVHLGNNGARRLRLKIVAVANTTLEITPHGKQ